MFKTIVALSAAFTITNALTIPSGFQLVNEKYLVSDVEYTFFEALVACKQYGMTLVTVSNEEEISLLLNTVPQATSYWLGGVYLKYDNIFHPKWIWLESGEEASYTKWKSGEPNLQTGLNCIVMSDIGEWIAYSCEDHSYRFICQS